MADSPQPVSGLNHQYQHFSFGGLAGLTSAYTHTNNGIFNATHTLAEPSPLLPEFSSLRTLDANAVRLYNKEQDTGNLVLTASVCFITDAGNCSGAGTGSDLGGSSSSGSGPIEPDNEERCRLEGYTNQKCGTGQTTGSKCPYDGNWHSGCTCNPEYNKTCTGANEQGKGTACDGKYKECCNPCNGYDYTASNIPAGYVKSGSCNSCDGIKYKVKCDPSQYNQCTSGGTGTCTDDYGTYYKECDCPANYEWDSVSKSCVCSTIYKYNCVGEHITGGDGQSCDNQYAACKCETGYVWDAEQGKCVSTCQGIDWCTLTPDCAALGYAQQSCTGKSVKCPFNTSFSYCLD